MITTNHISTGVSRSQTGKNPLFLRVQVMWLVQHQKDYDDLNTQI